MVAVFLKGIVTGMVLSMPMGPISVLCIQRTLYYGIRIGLITAIGSSLADGLFASIAAFGLTAISNFFTGYQFWIHLIGAFFLLYLGINMFRSSPHDIDLNLKQTTTALRAFISSFFMTITNPITIFSFLGLFAGLGLAHIEGGYREATIMVIGIMIGSTLWEFFLSLSIKIILHHRINTSMMRFMNYISGSAILVFAALSFKL